MWIRLAKLGKQGLSILQNRRAETFSEPPVDRRQQIMRLGALALIPPQAGEASSGAQLVKFGALSPCDRDGFLKACLGGRQIALGR